jgi:hypothetical protein
LLLWGITRSFIPDRVITDETEFPVWFGTAHSIGQ